MSAILDQVLITDHFLRRWYDRVENLDIEEQAEEYFGRPREQIGDGEWIFFVQSRGICTTSWKKHVRRTIGVAPYTGRIVVGCWVVITKNGKAVTVKPAEGA